MRTAVFFLCHKIGNEVEERFRSIAACDHETRRTYLLINRDRHEFETSIDQDRIVCVPTRLAKQLPYSDKMSWHEFVIVPGNTELLILLAKEQVPIADHYLSIEYDVGFAGSWNEFLSALDQCETDMLATNIRRRKQEPDWMWWKKFSHPAPEIANPAKSLNCVMRLSRRALEALAAAYLAGWKGHGESTIVNVIEQAGLSLGDLRKSRYKEFNIPLSAKRDWYDPKYFQATPIIEDPSVVTTGTLFHPMKLNGQTKR